MAADPHPKASEYHPIQPNFGYCLTLDHANELIKKHEQSTWTSFALLRSDPNFGKGIWNNKPLKIKWMEGEKAVGKPIPYDGIPFIIIGTRHLGCQFASSGASKMDKCMQMKKDPDGSTCELKRENCPAKIILKEVIKFPDYKMEDTGQWDMNEASERLRNDLLHTATVMEPRIYIDFPSPEGHVHNVVWKKTDKGVPIPSANCLVCNAKFSSPTTVTISIFSEEARTSHRQLEVHSVLGKVLEQDLGMQNLHSTSICIRCFNLLDDIDSLEEQLSNKKRVMAERYARTMRAVAGHAMVSDESDGEFEDAVDDISFTLPSKRPRFKSARRGRPPGRPKGKGTGRPRGRPRGSSQRKSSGKAVVKEEKDGISTAGTTSPSKDTENNVEDSTASISTAITSAPAQDNNNPENLTMSILTAITSPSSWSSIKKEELHSNMNSPVGHPSRINEGAVGNETIVAVGEPEDAIIMEDQVSIELEDVTEAVGEVLEHEKKQMEKYSCSECDQKFISKAAVQEHVKAHGHRVTYTCEECGKPFLNKCLFQAHMKTHEPWKKPFACDICSRSYSSKRRLNTHVKTHTEPREYICDICGKSLTTQQTLDLHALTHSGERPFQCDICGATFRQRGNLYVHIKATHYREKKHVCHMCPKSFVRKRLLVYHINSVHTDARPYKCELCPSTFVYPQHYKRHLRKHNGEKPHTCHICSKQFKSRDNRNAHLFIHSTKKPYECKMCGTGFMRKALCVAHVATHTFTEDPEANIIFNSPSQLHHASQMELPQEMLMIPDLEVARAAHSVRKLEEL